MNAVSNLGWQIVALTLIGLAYKILDKHFQSKNLSQDVSQKLIDLERKVNEVSLANFGRR